jgi:type IV pilus assembly protein PilM
LSSKPFKGRKVVSCLPSRELLIQHLRVPKMDEAELERALPFEAQTKVPFNIAQGRLCHVVAGEVYEGTASKLEVILMAASGGVVSRNLNLLERTKIEIESINVEPCALVSCFGHLLDQSEEQLEGTMFIDLGHSCSKVVITHGRNIVFCRTIGTAADQLIRTISSNMEMGYPEAEKLLYGLDKASKKAVEQNVSSKDISANKQRELTQVQAGVISSSGGGLATMTEDSEEAKKQTDVMQVIRPTLQNMCDEFRGCIRYHDMIFDAQPTQRVIFLGGLAKNTRLCQQLARSMGLPAQLADPVSRIDSATLTGNHSDLIASERHSDWAVAIGLSLSGKENS